MRNRKNSEAKKICFVVQAITPGTHMDYVYEMARTLKEEAGLHLVLLIEKSVSIRQPDWVLTQRFRYPLFRIVENFYILFRLRLSGYRTFYIHYSFISAIGAGIITKILGGKVYYWNAGMPWLYKRSWFEDSYQKLAYRLVDVLVTGAKALVSGYNQYYDVPKDRIKVISNWIDFTKLERNGSVRNEVRRELNIPPNAPTLLFVQKLSKRKGAHLLPDIFDRLSNSESHIIIAGDGPEERFLHVWQETHAASSRIHFTGRVTREKMKELYQTSDVFLLPSEEEGSPHSLIEAMAYGLPFVGFSVGGVPETVSSDLQKWLCPYGDIDLFVGNVEEILSIDQNRNTDEIKKRAMSFDKQKIVKEYIALLLDG